MNEIFGSADPAWAIEWLGTDPLGFLGAIPEMLSSAAILLSATPVAMLVLLLADLG